MSLRYLDIDHYVDHLDMLHLHALVIYCSWSSTQL